MGIIGFNLSRIEAERKKPITGKLNITNSPKVTNVETTDIQGLGKEASKGIKVEFEFSTEYEPKIGYIRFTGELIYIDVKQDDVIKQWKKEKKLPDTMMVEIINFLFRRFITKSLNIAEELQMPPSIPYPTASVPGQEQKSPKYIE